MKRLFPALALFAALIFAAQAATAAKKPKDQEFRHIAITLSPGIPTDGPATAGRAAAASGQGDYQAFR